MAMKVRNYSILILISVILFNQPTSSIAQAKIKAGQNCYKLNEIKKVNQISFVCSKSKSGKKWKVLENSSNKSNKEIEKNLKVDSRITSSNLLSDIKICKTIDLSSSSGNNGFPRPNSVITKTKANILVLPIVFDDLPYTEKDFKSLSMAMEYVSKFFAKMSFGRFNLEVAYPSKELWVKMNKPAAEYGIFPNKPQQNNVAIVKDAINLASPKIDFDKYDAVILESGYTEKTAIGQGFIGETFKGQTGSAKGVTLQMGTAIGSPLIISHELGHALFALEDLYIFLNSNRPSVPDPQPAGKWDLMSDNSGDFFAWNKYLMGWLRDEEVRCVTNQNESTHYLVNVNSESGEKLVLINLSQGVTIAIENRDDIYTTDHGLLVYKIDTNINHGNGPITANKKLLIKDGDSSQILNWSIELIAKDKSGSLFTIKKMY